MVGEGREKFGHVFLADTGTSNGDITGQTRPINTVDFKVRVKNIFVMMKDSKLSDKRFPIPKITY